jgi:dienelactone hydrolase
MNDYKEKLVKIPLDDNDLEGNLIIPENAKGLVLFAHGSGSSRFSPRNKFVAEILNEGGIATLLIDLLTAEEEEVDNITRELRFDISLLTERLLLVTEWLKQSPETKSFSLGYFGSSTGAAAALAAAAIAKNKPQAVVSRGGRPDLASPFLPKVTSPVLLIVGGDDYGVIELNQQAYEMMNCEKKLVIVPGATHLFEEPGTLENVGHLARQWFSTHF